MTSLLFTLCKAWLAVKYEWIIMIGFLIKVFNLFTTCLVVLLSIWFAFFEWSIESIATIEVTPAINATEPIAEIKNNAFFFINYT